MKPGPPHLARSPFSANFRPNGGEDVLLIGTEQFGDLSQDRRALAAMGGSVKGSLTPGEQSLVRVTLLELPRDGLRKGILDEWDKSLKVIAYSKEAAMVGP